MKKTVIFTLILLIALQFIQIDRTNPAVDESIALHTEESVQNILKSGCYDCHSNETKWPTYSYVAPVSFFVASHVKKGRKALNFSQWKDIDPEIKKKRLERAIMTVNNGRMALPSYLLAHDDAKLSKENKEILIKWFEKELENL